LGRSLLDRKLAQSQRQTRSPLRASTAKDAMSAAATHRVLFCSKMQSLRDLRGLTPIGKLRER